ncbi:hypothetical protein C0J52_23160 [Blattella germanica]|nr:hypothetical protein C0J52_23160 [Blattella germanica]
MIITYPLFVRFEVVFNFILWFITHLFHNKVTKTVVCGNLFNVTFLNEVYYTIQMLLNLTLE